MHLIVTVCVLVQLLQLVCSSFLDIPLRPDLVTTNLDNASSVGEVFDESTGYQYVPHSPLVNCSFLPKEFIQCELPLDLNGNETLYKELRYGCLRWGGRNYEDVARTALVCHALKGIECFGGRTFLRPGYPCVKFRNQYFLTNLLYSLLLGFLGIDRFCLGHTGTAVGKLLTLGGVGFWWLVDIVLLIRGDLRPADESSWMPFY